VQIFERDFSGGRWYLSPTVVHNLEAVRIIRTFS
jgi:hypothetical protein